MASVLALVSLAACAAGAEAPDLPGIDDIAVTVFRNRGDDLQRVFTVKVANTTDARLLVATVDLRTTAYRTSGPTSLDRTVAPGLRVDLRVPVGAPGCGPEAQADTATVELRLADTERPQDITVVTREVDATELRKAADRECRIEAVRELTSPAFAADWLPGLDADGRPVVDGILQLSVDPAANETVTVTAVEPTVIFAPTTTGLPATAAPGETLDIAVRMSSGRCDPHAVAEATTKYGYIFGVRIAIGDAEPVFVPVTVDPATRGPLAQMLDVRCGLT